MLREVSIEIIRKCQNHCLHCSSESDKSCPERLPLSKFKEVVFDAAKLGAETICLSGGEPFLHSDVHEMINYIHALGLMCFIYTSGIVCDSTGNNIAISKDFLSCIAKDNTKLIFNIEAATEETYNRIMGTARCFSIMQESVQNAVSLGFLIEAHFVPMKLNINEIDAVIKLCKYLKISKVSFLRLVPHGRAEKHLSDIMLSVDQTVQLKEKLKKLQEQYKDAIRIGVPLSSTLLCHKCEAADGKLNIRYDGKVFPCEVFKNCPLTKSLGQLRPNSIYEDTLLDIYQESAYLQFIRNLSTRFYRSTEETCLGQHLLEIERSNSHG